MASEPEKPDRPGNAEDRKPPVLTERQRAEARRRRQAKRRRDQRAQPGNALSRGVRASGQEIVRTARYIARAVAAAFEATGPVGRSFRSLLRRLGSGIASLAATVTALLAGLARGIGRALALLDRMITPRRALLVVAGLGVVALVASQFTEYRATAIGQPGYSGIEAVTSAPRVDVRTPLDTHSILQLTLAVAAAAGLAGVLRTGRRKFAGLLLAAGVASLIVTLAIDLPRGLGTGDAGLSYSGVSALLLSGFWLELAAGVLLTVSGALLLPEPEPSLRRRSRVAVRSGSPA